VKKWITQKWLSLGLLSILWLLFTILYAAVFIEGTQTSSRTYEIVKFVFLSVSAFGVLFSSLLNSFNSLEASKNVNERTEFDRQNINTRIEFDKIENSFHYIGLWESAILREVRDVLRDIDKRHKNITPAELVRSIESDKNTERSAITILNFFEEIHISRKAGRVNDLYLKETFRIPYLKSYDILSSWMATAVNKRMRDNLEELRLNWLSE
jgi:hypothetical protein